MANSPGLRPVRLPLIDRLLGDQDLPKTRAESVRRMRNAVRRDLEWLLNSRRPADELPEGCTEVEKSVHWYGLPDIFSQNLSSQADRAALVRTIQSAIASFEPRLAAAKVSLAPGPEESLPQLRFIIEGLLRMDPTPERVSFDTVLEVLDGAYHVRGEAGD